MEGTLEGNEQCCAVVAVVLKLPWWEEQSKSHSQLIVMKLKNGFCNNKGVHLNSLVWNWSGSPIPTKDKITKLHCSNCVEMLVVLYCSCSIWTLCLHQLINFLNDDQNRLAGVEIEKDAHKLARDYGLTCKNQNLVELRTLAVNTCSRPDLKRSGFKTLAREILGLSMVKPKKISRSNWEREDLSASQIEYACIDAYISFTVAQKLLEDLP
eukprot:Gb_39054 [translate_table: standard]